MSGYTMTQPELYYSLPATVTRNNYVTATQACMTALTGTSVQRCVIPALYFSVIGKSVHFEINGTITGTASPTLALAMGLDVTAATIGGSGGATLFTAPTTTPGSTATPFTAVFDLVAQAVGSGTTNPATTLQCNGEVNIHGGATNTWSTGRNTNMISSSLTGINNEINLYLEMFATWTGTVTSSDTTSVTQFKVYLEN